MHLFADRFAIDDDGDPVDLATGRCIQLRRIKRADIAWAGRCDWWLGLRHRAFARLIDYGPTGRDAAFEAWDCGRSWEGSAEEAVRIRGIADRFLDASGWTMGSATVHASGGRAVVVPDPMAGYERVESSTNAARVALGVRGMTAIPRPATAALAEMFESVGQKRPSIASLWGAPGSGKRSIVLALARIARIKGFVPVTSRLLASRCAALWLGRSLFIIHAECDDEDGGPWRLFLRATLGTPLAHTLLIVGEREDRLVDGIGLRPIAVDALVRAVRPSVVGSGLEERVRRAALDARGSPGKFTHSLWPDGTVDRAARRRTRALRAAERVETYASDGPIVRSPPPVVGSAWPSPGELSSLRTRVTSAIGQLAAGRHAPAIRQLRQTAAAFARRDAWSDAVDAGVAVARALLERGRPREVLTDLEDTASWAERGGEAGNALDIAVLSGEARIDLTRFDEAEAVLAAALAAASHAADACRSASAAIALARCLFWRGQYADAASALDRAPDDGPLPLALRIRKRRLRARVEVGRGDVAAAMVLVDGIARDLADCQVAGVRAAAACTAGFVHLAVGDLDGAARDAHAAIAAARAAHDPLRALRARFIAIEVERRRRRPIAAAMLGRIKRIRGALPPLLRARCDLMAGLAAAGGDAEAAIVKRHVAESGVTALALYARGDAERAGVDRAVDDLLVILRTCQTADDEAIVLKDVCAHVKRQLNALGAAFLVRAAGVSRPCDVIAADGGPIETAIAERAMAASIVIRPHRLDERIEGAAPVMYGGAPVGALAARWSIGSAFDADRAASVLAMSATAAAPLVAIALAHRARAALPEGAAVAPILGLSQTMVELRQTAKRAGAAPFCALIVGESGSGKELVASAIHRSSARRDGPFCTLNCAALPDDLVESELFGHVRGAFTGAIADRPGVFEEAHGGTLFLDEVGELSPRAQAKILRVIQEGELRRVGENAPRRVDVRLIAATNRDLAREVESGRFRMDLLYRLDVIRIVVPPLRDRADDVAVLAAQFWSDATARVNSRATLSPATLAALRRYHWPGNVRELQNVLAALAVRSPKRGIVPPNALPPQFSDGAKRDETWRLDEARRTFEERFVRAALVRTGGHRTRAAAELGVSRQGLTKLLARLGIAP